MPHDPIPRELQRARRSSPPLLTDEERERIVRAVRRWKAARKEEAHETREGEGERLDQ